MWSPKLPISTIGYETWKKNSTGSKLETWTPCRSLACRLVRTRSTALLQARTAIIHITALDLLLRFAVLAPGKSTKLSCSRVVPSKSQSCLETPGVQVQCSGALPTGFGCRVLGGLLCSVSANRNDRPNPPVLQPWPPFLRATTCTNNY